MEDDKRGRTESGNEILQISYKIANEVFDEIIESKETAIALFSTAVQILMSLEPHKIALKIKVKARENGDIEELEKVSDIMETLENLVTTEIRLRDRMNVRLREETQKSASELESILCVEWLARQMDD